jgi:signal transduction histidine kinase
VDGEPRPLAREAGLAVYRTTQEALTNIRKHAKAAEAVTVALRWRPDGLSLTVEDRHPDGRGAAPPGSGVARVGPDPGGAGNGVGPDGATAAGGYGLTGMRERAELLGGELVAGGTAEGFEVRLWLPA